MLVLTRRLREAIIVDGPCKITVLECGPGKTRLGIEAEEDVNIWREELLPLEPKEQP